MDRTVKGTIAVVLSALVLAVAVYGSYLPLRKTQMFIATLRDLQARPATSLEDLENRITPPLDALSPIGQEELVRNVANSVLGLVQRGADATSTAKLIGFLNRYYDPIIARGKGMSFGQDLYLLGAINETAFARTGDRNYLEAARRYYLKAVEFGPNRPQALLGLFDIYRALVDVANTKLVAERILTNWPAADNIRQALAQFLDQAKKQGLTK